MNQQRMFGSIHPCLVMSESIEWYTPRSYIEAARRVMGSIDVDPASDPRANEVVQAAIYYTKETNGFTKRWPGNVWLNPPYGKEGNRSNQARWSARLIEQYQVGTTKQAILLVNAKTGDKWFHPLWDYPICFAYRRINFSTPNGNASSSATHSSAFVYFGPYEDRFREVFRQFGRVVMADPLPAYPTLWTGEEEVTA